MEQENQYEMERPKRSQRRRGRPAGLITEKYTISLEVETAEWAKQQPGGLSHFLRARLREAYDKDGPS